MRSIKPVLLSAAAAVLLASCSKTDDPTASAPPENVLRIDGRDYQVADFGYLNDSTIMAHGGTSDRKGGMEFDFGEKIAPGEYPIVAYPAKGHEVSVGALTMISGVDRYYPSAGSNYVKLTVSGSAGHYHFLLPPIEAKNEIDKAIQISAHIAQ